MSVREYGALLTDHGQAGSYRFVRRISTDNALVLTGLANFWVVGHSEGILGPNLR